jgi:hypothetical protein
VSPTTFTLSASQLIQTPTLKVYVDHSIEMPDTLSLQYVLDANRGNASPGTINQTYNFFILDNDVIPSGASAEVYYDNFDVPPTDITIDDSARSLVATGAVIPLFGFPGWRFKI